MKSKLFLALLLCTAIAAAQPINKLYTVVTKFLPSNNVFDNTVIRLGEFNPVVGMVDNIGTATIPRYMGVNVGVINQATNKYNLITPNSLLSFDLLDGAIVETPITSFHTGITAFTNLRFSITNNNLYGLASTFVGNYDFTGMFLSKLDTQTGVLTKISQNSVGGGYSWLGCAINPEEMVYYYADLYNLNGIDLYNGSNYSSQLISYSGVNDYNFFNFSYSCSANEIFGLVTEDTGIPHPTYPAPNTLKKMRLGKINPSTGIVSRISEVELPVAGASLNAGVTIDTELNIYYFSDGYNVYGVSTETGLLVSNATITYEDGSMINYITNLNNCTNAEVTRQDPSLALNTIKSVAEIKIFPNPINDILNIISAQSFDKISLTDALGKNINMIFIDSKSIDTSALQSGIYFLNLQQNGKSEILKLVKI